MVIDKFVLENEDKVTRAIFGSVGSEGKLHGGVGEKADESAILAEYDRLGGLVTMNERKVITGSFYDFAKKAPREKPEVVLEVRVDGKVVNFAADDVPLEVLAKEKLEGKTKKKPKKKAKKVKKDEDES